jgi:hypothetical protein
MMLLLDRARKSPPGCHLSSATTSAGERSVIVLCAHVGFVRVEENTIFSTSFIHRDTARSRGSASSWSATPGQQHPKPS